MNFYEERLLELQKLIDQNEIEQALKLINEELSMPYVPKDFEDDLIKLRTRILVEKINNEEHHLSSDKIFSLIKSDQTDLVEKVGLVKQLEESNLRKHISELQDLLNSDLTNEVKMMIIYLLNQQGINNDFNYKKNSKTLKINPMTFDFQTQEMVPLETIKLIDDELGSFSPQLVEMGKQIMVSLYGKLFPIQNEIDCAILAKAIIKIVYELNDLPYNSNNGLDENKINEYKQMIKDLEVI
ncbi:DUF3196 family protein [Mesoplasma lactucae]|uniref:DUF3196 family protein n=1 Tax=Mesoplasma lactucae TaxID=138853 RepID=UPI000CA3CDD4|nr:DUF3196 family protein [Mesoplasma lactucae]ATZ20225.1 hypothetical protein MLACT_v1c04040 [Mesoplasma lactucae ATCC 49193]MCL8216974.1 hypothetical protein [Mesoplasma lactucae ATCC 49193]